MSEKFSIGMSLPLDSDGFLRRECQTCEREFKWRPNSAGEDEPTPMPDGGYFCPYCGVQAPTDAWWTKAQAELAQRTAAAEVVGPMLDDFASGVNRSGGMFRVEVSPTDIEKPEPLSETGDMTRVDFSCHQSEPVKVLDDWDKPVRCLLCGGPSS
jgi:DNA-directed RNA polymerase subunit RPC12/RpoP